MDKKYTKKIYLNVLTLKEFEHINKVLIDKSDNVINNESYIQYKVDDNTITFYKKSNKILVQGKNIVPLIVKLNLPYVRYQKTDEEKNSYEQISLLPKNEDINFSEYIGCDEVGNGDFFGGITFAAVYVNEETINFLKQLGVDDSKKLTDDFIIQIYPEIIKKCKYVQKIMYPKEYNELYSKFQNINTVKTFGHNYCITKIQLACNKHLQRHVPVIMDQYCHPSTYQKHLLFIDNKIENYQKVDHFETKAESKYIGVAAASVIARYNFIKMMNELNEKLHNRLPKLNKNIKIPFGSTNVELIKKIKDIIINEISPEVLTEFLKTNFSFQKDDKE